MAQLYYDNLGIPSRPELTLLNTYHNLRDFYQYLERAKRHIENTISLLAWRLAGVWVQLPPGACERMFGEDPPPENIQILISGRLEKPLDIYPELDLLLLQEEPGAEKIEIIISQNNQKRKKYTSPYRVNDEKKIQKLPDLVSQKCGEPRIWVELINPPYQDIPERVYDDFFQEKRQILEYRFADPHDQKRRSKYEAVSREEFEVLDRKPREHLLCLNLRLREAPTRAPILTLVSCLAKDGGKVAQGWLPVKKKPFDARQKDVNCQEHVQR